MNKKVKCLGWYRPEQFYAIELNGKKYCVHEGIVRSDIPLDRVKGIEVNRDATIIPLDSEQKKKWNSFIEKNPMLEIVEE